MTLYLDTSSLVKLYVAETGSDAVRALLDRATVVATSSVAYAEARAAFARLRRDRRLSAAAHADLKRHLDADWPAYLTIDAGDALCRSAGELTEQYRLRGFDSIHLASFAEVARRAGVTDTRFSSFDEPLNQAARTLARRLARG
ncbi:MAG: type II toxin-antitoxin system VapC family toxin [Vicinamibacterales bacterium]